MATPVASSARQGRNVLSIRGRTASGWIALAVAVVAALLAVWGWSQWTGQSAHSSPPVAVSGKVVVVGGPADPLTGGLAIPLNHPQPERYRRILVTGTTTTGAAVRRHLATDSHGRFALTLPTGTYRVTAKVDGNTPDQLSDQITVRRGHPVHLRFTDAAP